MTATHFTLEFPNGVPLHCTRWGPATARTTYVFVHGAPGSAKDFDVLGPLLVAPGTNVIAFDLPGNGRTSADVVGGYYYIDSAAVADVVATALSLLPPARFLLVGHSMGGHTTVHVAARGCVDGILLMNPMGLRAGRRHQPRLEYWFGWLMRHCGDGPNALTRWNKSIYINKMRFPDTIPELEFVAAFYRMTTADFDRVAIDADAIRDQQIPVFVALTKDDKVIEYDIGTALAARLGTKNLLILDKGGHNIVVTQAQTVAKAVHEWTATLSPL
ncbi:serine protease family S33 [Achlya hypogyna]|uniref:Serine protease family S33 n=1 Tax=Achlya hypogyna TaxID=1202772 RepID=A0A1V9YNY3_ACHHY|nr:serine protease family S33 [Achlya hypogyna]